MCFAHKLSPKTRSCFSTFQLFNISTRAIAAGVLCVVAAAARASHVSETMTLAKGWNAIYLESTPTNATCESFFADAPVSRVAVYNSNAYSNTRQLADDGTEITQKPISYNVWIPGDGVASTMSSLVGGRPYMIYATNEWTKTFLGVPAVPRQTWREATTSSGFMNLVGVSAAPDATMTLKAYFGEGPFGTAKGVAYRIGGTKTSAPSFLPMAITASPKVVGSMAYALTAESDASWPGVIDVKDSSLYFGPDSNFESITVHNNGTTNHTFRFTLVKSAIDEEKVPALSRKLPRVDAVSSAEYTNVEENVSWTVDLAANTSTVQMFSFDRSGMQDGETYAAVLTIEDLGASKMRVRIPVVVAAAAENDVAYPTGLWMGEIALTQVSTLTNLTPVKAGGQMKVSVMMHVDTNGTCRLLQRVAAGLDTNGTARLFKELESVPDEIEGARRFSTLMMSVDTPIVPAAEDSAFGDDADFSWVVPATARDNPFRHAWHPDHDGLKADYEGEAPSGDDFANYMDPVKPELWSISNRLDFSWHELGNRSLERYFPYNADETTSGIVTWEVTGLVADGPIKSVGTFTLRRVFKANAIE